MTSLYEGEDVYPDELTLPDDSEPEDVASVLVPIEALADRTRYLKAKVGEIAALNFTTSVGSIGAAHRAAAYDPVLKKWYLVGASGNVRSSSNGGWTWDGASLIATPANETESCCALDIDTSGNVVVTNAGLAAVFTLTASSGTWAKTNLGGGGTINGGGDTQVTYDPVNALWCVLSSDAVGGGAVCYTSPDRAAWTNRGGPVTSNGGGTTRMACKKSTGKLAAIYYAGSGTDLEVFTSSDGGVTFTARATLTTTISSPTLFSMAYSPNEDEWLYTVGEVSGTAASEVWRSTDDGVTWTKMATLAASCLVSIAPLGELWLACVRTSSEIAYSLDSGATWRPSGFGLTATAIAAASSETQFLVVSSGVVYPGLRARAPTTAVLT